MKELNKMIGTIMKETGFNYEFVVELPFQELVDLYLECRSKEKLVRKSQDTDKVITKLKNQLGCSHHFAVEIVRNEETRKMVIDGLLDLVNELKGLGG